MKPIEVQRKRVKGWKMPENTISVTRPGKWGNPFITGKITMLSPLEAALMSSGDHLLFEDLMDGIYIKDAKQAVDLFEKYASVFGKKIYEPLRGKNLACWCKIGDPCHRTILLKIANK